MASPGRQPESCCHEGDVDESSTTPTATSESRQQGPPPAVLFSHSKPPGTSDGHLPGILAPEASVFGSSSGKSEGCKEERSSFFRPASNTPPGRDLHTAKSTRTPVDKVDALWAEMQASLEESELSLNRSTHFFGPDHDLRLAELHSAQIEMAQAWARSRADDDIENTHRDDLFTPRGDGARIPTEASAEATRMESGEMTDAAQGSLGADNAQPSGSSSNGEADHTGTSMGEETEEDIKLARKRRETNDEYFQKVSGDVARVVAKLEDVVVAMRTVEHESKGVWA